MITFSRGVAQAYLVALAVWLAGFVVIVAIGLRGGVTASVGPLAILLTLMFAAAAAMLAIAVRMSGAVEYSGPTPASPYGQQGRWLLLLGLRWVFLLFGVAAQPAFRALDSDR